MGVRSKETVQKLSRCDISVLGCQMKKNTRSRTDGGRERLERQNKRRGRAESYMNDSDKKTKTERRYSKRENGREESYMNGSDKKKKERRYSKREKGRENKERRERQ